MKRAADRKKTPNRLPPQTHLSLSSQSAIYSSVSLLDWCCVRLSSSTRWRTHTQYNRLTLRSFFFFFFFSELLEKNLFYPFLKERKKKKTLLRVWSLSLSLSTVHPRCRVLIIICTWRLKTAGDRTPTDRPTDVGLY